MKIKTDAICGYSFLRGALTLFLFANIAFGQSADGQARDASQRSGQFQSNSRASNHVFHSVHVSGSYIAITFDDGPNGKLTPKLLDLLGEKKIKATFFVLGENAVRYPAILKRAFTEGHEIGNHSWSHTNFAKASEERVRTELQKTEDVIWQAIGVRPTIMRPPYGELTPSQRQWVYTEFGYSVVLWDVDPLDWKEPGPAVIAERIVGKARAGSIVLSHDIHAQTIAAMPGALDGLIAKGFKFVTVSELLAMANNFPAATSRAAENRTGSTMVEK